MNNGLEPCPFCGAPAEFFHTVSLEVETTQRGIHCTAGRTSLAKTCAVSPFILFNIFGYKTGVGYFSVEEAEERKAIYAWNHRP